MTEGGITEASVPAKHAIVGSQPQLRPCRVPSTTRNTEALPMSTPRRSSGLSDLVSAVSSKYSLAPRRPGNNGYKQVTQRQELIQELVRQIQVRGLKRPFSLRPKSDNARLFGLGELWKN